MCRFWARMSEGASRIREEVARDLDPAPACSCHSNHRHAFASVYLESLTVVVL